MGFRVGAGCQRSVRASPDPDNVCVMAVVRVDVCGLGSCGVACCKRMSSRRMSTSDKATDAVWSDPFLSGTRDVIATRMCSHGSVSDGGFNNGVLFRP